jgi:hypothetical protein
MRADQELMEQRQALRQKEASLAELQGLRERAQQDPWGALEALGVNHQALWQGALEQDAQQHQEPEPVYVTELREQNQKLAQQMEQLTTQYSTDREQRAERATKKDIQTSIGVLEGHEMVKYAGLRAVEDIYALAKDARERGHPITFQHAAKVVNDYYTKEAGDYIEVLRKSDTYGSLFKEQGEPAAPGNGQPQSTAPPAAPPAPRRGAYVAPTVSPSMVAEPPTDKSPDEMSDLEHQRYAMQLAEQARERARKNQ